MDDDQGGSAPRVRRASGRAARPRTGAVTEGKASAGFPQALTGLAPFLLNWTSSRLNLNLLHALRPLNITGGRWRVLVVLTARNGSSITEIAQDCAMEQSTLSRIIDQMERDGLAERRLRPEDNRVTEVHLTPKGSRLYEFVLPTAQAEAARLLQPLSEKERRQLVAYLLRIAEGLRG